MQHKLPKVICYTVSIKDIWKHVILFTKFYIASSHSK